MIGWIPRLQRLVGKLPQLKVVSLSVDVPAPEVDEFCDYVRRHGKQVLRIYIDNRYVPVEMPTHIVASELH
jgi:hypothetical protein